jgi:hypothetical protein
MLFPMLAIPILSPPSTRGRWPAVVFRTVLGVATMARDYPARVRRVGTRPDRGFTAAASITICIGGGLRLLKNG